jgi:phosphatidylserine decarboxylase
MTSNTYRQDKREASLLDRIFALTLYLLPHHLLSSGMHWLARNEWPPLKDLLIRAAIRVYDIDLDLAEEPDPARYRCFNDFFTRALRPEARPLAEDESSLLCPVDGTISQAGRIEDGRIFQAKGQSFSLFELLGGDPEWTKAFDDGSFATIYLSPRDYHRIHMPATGVLKKMLHVPGRLFSVSPSTTRVVPRLFSRNERLVNLFETDQGPMAVIMVGAIFVASMDTVWAGSVTPLSQKVSRWDYTGAPPDPVSLEAGDEMGRFNMGSTVVLLFGKDAVSWSEGIRPGARVEMGQEIARIN